MNINDVVALARAGFNREQIAALAGITAPGPQVQPTPEPKQEPSPARQVQNPAPTHDDFTKLMVALGQTTQAVQGFNLGNAEQTAPKQQSADDIIASIINPPTK